ncbi:MAG: DUF1345 domain-containing protein [Mycobacterium sp.]
MVRIGVAAPLGVAAGILVGDIAGWQYAPAAGWITTTAIYLPWTWALIATMKPAAIASLVQQRHPTRTPADTIVVLASIASLGGVGYLLTAANVEGPDVTIAAAIGILSVIASWLTVHTVFTVRYAVHYYTQPVGGVNFNQHDEPTFADFAYLAFTIGMTYQVSDTALQSRPIRTTALLHAMLSYLLGAGILAITINLVTGLAGFSV